MYLMTFFLTFLLLLYHPTSPAPQTQTPAPLPPHYSDTVDGFAERLALRRAVTTFGSAIDAIASGSSLAPCASALCARGGRRA